MVLLPHLQTYGYRFLSAHEWWNVIQDIDNGSLSGVQLMWGRLAFHYMSFYAIFKNYLYKFKCIITTEKKTSDFSPVAGLWTLLGGCSDLSNCIDTFSRSAAGALTFIGDKIMQMQLWQIKILRKGKLCSLFWGYNILLISYLQCCKKQENCFLTTTIEENFYKFCSRSTLVNIRSFGVILPLFEQFIFKNL